MSLSKTVAILPRFEDNALGGVARHIEALKRHLPTSGWEVVDDPREASIVHCHATATFSRVDVYTNHGTHPMTSSMPQWQKSQNLSIFKNLKMSRRVITVANWTAEQWQHLVGVTPEIIPNGIDLEEWVDVPKGRWRAKLQIDPRIPIVLWGKVTVSQICDPTPAIDLALRRPDVAVVTTMKPGSIVNPPTNLYMVGPQSFESMRMLLADCDVYLATTQENHSVQVLEAMALEKPILGYEWGGTAETVRHGHEGILCKPGDLQTLARDLGIALKLHGLLGENGRKTVEERYQSKDLVARVAQVYEETLREIEHELDPLQPKVSVVIPVYNKKPWIRQTLQSVFSQVDAPPYEVIIMDDGSTDGSYEAIDEFVPTAPKSSSLLGVRLLQQENAGVANARNRAIAQSRGKYITCLDADDLLDTLALKTFSSALDGNPEIGIAYSDMVAFGERKGKKWENRLAMPDYNFDTLKKGNFIPCGNMFRKVAWQRAGGYKPIIDKYGPSWEDYELWLSMGEIDWPGYHIPMPLFYYRKLEAQGRDFESQPRAAFLRAIVNRLHRGLYTPLVSIVIPCFNYSRFLREAIDSVMAQTFPDFEIVVVDDASTLDEHRRIVEIVESYPPADVRLVTHSKNQGLAAARNTGISSARGSWIVPLDADDTIEPDFVEACLRGTGGDQRLFAYTDTHVWVPDNPEKDRVLQAEEYDFGRMLRAMSWTCTTFYPKSAWQMVGGYRPEMSEAGGWEDWELAISFGEVGICGKHIPKALVNYRQHSPQQMRRVADEVKPKLSEALRRLHPAVYRGERPMGCCNKGPAGATPVPERQVEGPAVMVRYIGPSVGTKVYTCPSGHQYTFGGASPLHSVHGADAPYFEGMPDFQVVGG